jgi:archaellum component FlaF (FlaF/FlaG flagellin family)
MNKQILKVVGILGFLIIGFSACDTIEVLEDVTSSQDDAAIQNVIDAVEDEAETQVANEMANLTSGCVQFIWDQPKGTFPNTLTIDFGTGCMGPNGRFHTGQITVYMTDTFYNAGAIREIGFVNYTVDSIAVEGIITTTNNGNASFTRDVLDAKITLPDGTVLRDWDANHTITKTAGVGTWSPLDDEFTITGGSSGVNRNGKTFTNTIITPLVKART